MLNYGGSSIKKACEDLKAAYPEAVWRGHYSGSRKIRIVIID